MAHTIHFHFYYELGLNQESLEDLLPIDFSQTPPQLDINHWTTQNQTKKVFLDWQILFMNIHIIFKVPLDHKNIHLLNGLAIQSAKTLDFVKSLSSNPEFNNYWPPKLPLLPFAFSLPKEISIDYIGNWCLSENAHRVFWAQSHYRREDRLGVWLDEKLKQFFDSNDRKMKELPDPIYPQIQGVDKNGNSVDEGFSLLPQDILENEANINIFLFIWSWYDADTAFKIMKRLLGPMNTKSTFTVAFAWIMQGIGSMFPLAADIAFQGRFKNESTFKDVHPSWRFMKIWQSCLKFKGCDKDGSFIKNWREIEKTICTENEWLLFTEDVTSLKNGDKNVLPLALENVSNILINAINLRIDQPHWFYSPTTYIANLYNHLPVPFVRFRERPYITTWLGPPLWKSDEEMKATYSELLNEVFFLWTGREVATSHHIRCPLCEFISDTKCSGTCSFSDWFEKTWGFHYKSIN